MHVLDISKKKEIFAAVILNTFLQSIKLISGALEGKSPRDFSSA